MYWESHDLIDDSVLASSTLRAKVSTGYGRLDEALGGGFLAGSAVVLSAPASDEVPLLLRNFLHATKEEGLLICRTLSSAQAVTQAENDYVRSLVCSDKPVPPSRNVIPGKGIDNLTEVNLQITDALSSVQPKRIVLGLLSDVLLRHKALQTRKWLSELLERLRAKKISTLAVLNPYMHSMEDVQAVVDLFDGNLEILEKDVEGTPEKFLRVNWMHGVGVAEKQFSLLDLMPVPQTPEIKYAKSGNVHIAYQVFGNGPVNVVVTPGAVSHLNYYWKEPGVRRWFEAVGEFARVAIFDKRGTGLSDRDAGVPTFEERMDDIRAVMDAAQFSDAVLVGLSEGVPMSILFAATYPSRTRGLVLYGGEAKGTRSPDYPWGPTPEQWEAYFEGAAGRWGTKEQEEEDVSFLAPSRIGDERFTHWLGEMFRMGTSPGASIALGRSEMNMDVRSILPAIHVPTIVIHLTDDKTCNIGEGRYIAERIPGARLIELPGADHLFFVDPKIADRILMEIREFALKVKPSPHVDKMLTTVLLTDIVEPSTAVVGVGDSQRRNLIEQYNSIVRNEVKKYSGVVIKNADGSFLATFDGPTRAIRCAWAITRSGRAHGIEARAGVHIGECTISPTEVTGTAVSMTTMILDKASAGEVLVSSTVADLVYGSGINFQDRGEHELNGVQGKRHLLSVASMS